MALGWAIPGIPVPGTKIPGIFGKIPIPGMFGKIPNIPGISIFESLPAADPLLPILVIIVCFVLLFILDLALEPASRCSTHIKWQSQGLSLMTRKQSLKKPIHLELCLFIIHSS